MIVDEHSEDCTVRQILHTKAINDWLDQWPDYCEECKGWGEFQESQSYPYGSTSATHYWSEPCECTENGICARCGEEGLTNEANGDESTGDGPCKFCGWDYDDGLAPEYDYPCECEVQEMQKDWLEDYDE